MAYSKKEKFGTKEQSLAAFAKALAHPARIAILSQLCKKKDANAEKSSITFHCHRVLSVSTLKN